MDDLKLKEYRCFDDINENWDGNLPQARAEVQQGKCVAISDIMFCHSEWRTKLENEMGVKIQWIFTENNALQCVKNCLFRFAFQKKDRPIRDEIKHIRSFSKVYDPQGDVRPVPQADNLPLDWA